VILTGSVPLCTASYQMIRFIIHAFCEKVKPFCKNVINRIPKNLEQYRTKIVRQMRRQIFRQMKQKAE